MASWIPGGDDGPAQPAAKPAPKRGGGGILGALGRVAGTAENVAGDVVAPVESAASTVGSDLMTGLKSTLKEGTGALGALGNSVRSAYSEEAQAAAQHENPLQAIGRFAAGAGKGLVGKEHTSFAQLVGAVQTGKPIAKKLPFGVETLGEIGTDPLTFTGLGATRGAEEGLAVLGKAAGQDVAANVVKQGLKKSGQEAALRDALKAAGKKPETVEKIVKAVGKSGQGGAKFLGHSIPGLTAESAVGQAASAAKDAAGGVVSNLPGASTVRGIFRTGGNLGAAEGVGQDAAHQTVDAIQGAGHAATAANTEVQRGLENVLKEYGPVSESDRATLVDLLEGGTKDAATAAPYTGIPSVMDDLMRSVKQNAAEAAGSGGPSYFEQGVQKLHNSGNSKLADLAEALNKVRHTTTAAQQAEGLLPFEHVTSEYLPHLLTPEGKAWMMKNREAVDRILGTDGMGPGEMERTLGQHGMTRARNLSGSVDSINQQMGAAGFKGKFLEDNPVALTAARAKVANTAVERSKMLDHLTEITGEDGKPMLTKLGPTDELPTGTDEIPLPELGRRYAGKPETLKLLHDSHALATDPDELQKVTKMAAGLNRIWKQYAIMTPAFHAKKLLGDTWMTMLASVKDPREIERGFSMAHAINKALDVVNPDTSFGDALRQVAPDMSADERKATEDFFRKGGTSNFVNNEVKGAGSSLSRAGKVGQALGKGVKANQHAASFISNGFRASVYLHTLEETGSSDAAMKAVNKFLFDYNDLTPAEKKLRSNVLPFYTFMRKNVPLQVEQALKQPGKYIALGAAVNDAKQHGAKYLPKDPASEANDFLGQLGAPGVKENAGAFYSMLSPTLKMVPEAGLGVNDLGQPLRTPQEKWGQLWRQLLPQYQQASSFKKKPLLQSILGFLKLAKPANSNAPAQSAGAPSADWIPR